MSDVPSDDPVEYCLNCGSALSGKYCSSCGQRNIPKRQTLGELLTNFIGSFFSFESKFLTTFRHILINPGFLAKEFNQGRRERYFHPARAYVFCSFVFFLIVFWNGDSDLKGDFTINDGSKKKPFVWKDSTDREQPIDFDSLVGYKSIEAYDSAQKLLPSEQRDGFLERFIERRSIELNNKYKGDQLQTVLAKTFFSNFPKVFFLLLPVFAALLKLLYIRRDYYYSEHLVFGTVFYNFFFADASIALLADDIPYMGWLEVMAYLWIPVCLLIAMRIMYRQGWMKTIGKYLLLVSAFTVCIAIGLLINLFITLIQI